MRLERIFGMAAIGFGVAASALVAMPQTASALVCGLGNTCSFTATLLGVGGAPIDPGNPLSVISSPLWIDRDIAGAARQVDTGFSANGLTFVGGGTSGGYVGSIPNVATSPFTDATDEYVVAQPGGSVTVSSVNPWSASNPLALVWGSVDQDPSRNLLTGNGFTLDGAEVLAACVGATAHVSSCLVTLSTSTAFSSLVMSDAAGSLAAFEAGFRGVPEPASLALFGTALAGLGLLRRRRKTTA